MGAEVGRARPPSSRDVLEKPFSGKTGNCRSAQDVSVFLLWSSAACDFPFVCLYTNAQTLGLEIMMGSALCLSLHKGVAPAPPDTPTKPACAREDPGPPADPKDPRSQRWLVGLR